MVPREHGPSPILKVMLEGVVVVFSKAIQILRGQFGADLKIDLIIIT